MKKMAYVNVTYLFSFDPEDFGLLSDCEDEELYNATSKTMEDFLERIGKEIDMYPNDVEITIGREE